MKFIRAAHVFDEDGTMVTFGIDVNGKVWIVTNTDEKAEGIEREYFGFSVHTFTELIHALVSLAFAALRFKLTESIHFTEDEPQSETIETREDVPPFTTIPRLRRLNEDKDKDNQ
jgi:hypothetical protein